MEMIDAKKEKYRFLSVHITARPLLSVGAIECFHKKGSFKMKLERQVKTQKKNDGKLGEDSDMGRPWRVWETEMQLKNMRQRKGSKGKLMGQHMILS